MRVYGECLSATTTTHVPWYAVPADDRDNARLIVSRILIDAFEVLDMACPRPGAERLKELRAIRKHLAG